MLRHTLVHFGHTVTEACNGKEGLKLFATGAADSDLVITDLVMPEVEGFEVLAELRTKLPRVKIMVISGGVRSDPDTYLEMASRLGAAKVLAKPFSNQDLMLAVNELLPPEVALA